MACKRPWVRAPLPPLRKTLQEIRYIPSRKAGYALFFRDQGLIIYTRKATSQVAVLARIFGGAVCQWHTFSTDRSEAQMPRGSLTVEQYCAYPARWSGGKIRSLPDCEEVFEWKRNYTTYQNVNQTKKKVDNDSPLW